MAALAIQFPQHCSQNNFESDNDHIEFSDEEIEAGFTNQEGDMNCSDKNDSETELPDLNI